MKYVVLTVKLDSCNDAFQDAPTAEVARILRALADRIDGCRTESDRGRLMDVNGNSVGSFDLDINEEG